MYDDITEILLKVALNTINLTKSLTNPNLNKKCGAGITLFAEV
jgi:hypothetical protein